MQSCVDLQVVSQYAADSQTSLNNLSKIGYSNDQNYKDFHCDARVYKYFPSLEIPTIDSNLTCSDSRSLATDAVYNKINTVLIAYLSGLGKLSDDKLVNYNYKDLTSSLDSLAKTSKVSLSATQINSVTSIAKILSDDMMDVYRRKQLARIIEKSNAPFQSLISTMIFCIDTNFKGVLNDSRNLCKQNYMDLKRNSKIDPGTQLLLSKQLQTQLSNIETSVKLCDNYTSGLKKIAAGHQSIYANRNALQLKNKDTRAQIAKYIADIQSIYSGFKVISKSN